MEAGGGEGAQRLGFASPAGSSMLSKDQEPKNVAGLTGKHLDQLGLCELQAEALGTGGVAMRGVAATAPSQDDDKARSPVREAGLPRPEPMPLPSPSRQL